MVADFPLLIPDRVVHSHIVSWRGFLEIGAGASPQRAQRFFVRVGLPEPPLQCPTADAPAPFRAANVALEVDAALQSLLGSASLQAGGSAHRRLAQCTSLHQFLCELQSIAVR